MGSFNKGGAAVVGITPPEEGEEVARRPSLPPPPNSGVTWVEYQSSAPGKPPTLGRRVVAKASSKQFKATVAMSEDFPMKVDMLLAVLEVVAPQFKHFQKLRDFVKLKLPPGFPIQVNIPVLPTVSAKVTFTDFNWAEGEVSLPESKFQVPQAYTLDPYRFPDL